MKRADVDNKLLTLLLFGLEILPMEMSLLLLPPLALEVGTAAAARAR